MIVDEIRLQVMNGLLAYDFSSAFPSGYLGAKAVTILHGNPFDLIDAMLAETDGQMTRPVLSVTETDVLDVHRSLGEVTNVGVPAGMVRRATRIDATFLIGCHADQRLGGADMVESLAGLVIGWAFLNTNSLAAYRQLRTSTSRGAFRDRPQLWHYDVILTGSALLSYDAAS